MQQTQISRALVYDRRCTALRVSPDFDTGCVDWIKQHHVIVRVSGVDDDDVLAPIAKKNALCAQQQWDDGYLMRSSDCRNRL
eukprot:7039439-Pyramimonas_sp.AAC.1